MAEPAVWIGEPAHGALNLLRRRHWLTEWTVAVTSRQPAR